MKKLLAFGVLMLLARPAAAQDIEAMARWTSYQIVHYKVVGEFSGETVLLNGAGKSLPAAVSAKVTDRIEIEFDWDQQDFNLVGKPVIRNFPTKVVSVNLNAEIGDGTGRTNRYTCPEPKLAGAMEFVTGLSLKTDDTIRMSGGINLQVRRDHPGGSFAAFPTDRQTSITKCGEYWETAKPASETSTIDLIAVPGMYLVMPIPPGQGGMKISPDKKSIILIEDKPGASGYGWTWTVTPTGVK